MFLDLKSHWLLDASVIWFLVCKRLRNEGVEPGGSFLSL